MVEQQESSSPEVCHHINTKRVQSNQFETDKNNINVQVHQMDFAMVYKCEYQNEIQRTLWSRGSTNLFTKASMNNGHTKSFLICTKKLDKDKETVLVVVEQVCDCLLIDNNKKYLEELSGQMDLHLNLNTDLLLRL